MMMRISCRSSVMAANRGPAVRLGLRYTSSSSRQPSEQQSFRNRTTWIAGLTVGTWLSKKVHADNTCLGWVGHRVLLSDLLYPIVTFPHFTR
jgi:hypothetical protein